MSESITMDSDVKMGSKIHRYFDKVYLVNLKKESEKRLSAYLSMKKSGIDVCIWDAEDGGSEENIQEFSTYQKRQLGQLHFSEFNELEINRGKGFIESKGAWGYLKTYRSILHSALENGLSRILIIEDDVILHDKFEEKFQSFIESVSDDWKVLQLGASQYNWESVDIGDALLKGYYHPQIIHTCGSFAIGIDLSIGSELLEAVSKMESPFDLIPLGKIYERYKENCFVAFPNLVMPDVATSSIRGSRSQSDHSIRMKWNMNQFRYPRPKPSVTILFEDPILLDLVDSEYLDKDNKVNLTWVYWAGNSWHLVHHKSSPCFDLEKSAASPRIVDLNKIADALPSDYVLHINRDNLDLNCTIEGIVERIIIEGQCPNGVTLLEKSNSIDNEDLVSIILPTYKRPDNLINSVRSLLNQTYQNIEVIIVDDNDPSSPEAAETESKVFELKKEDSRIKFVRHTRNLNGSAARNTGILYSSGAYIAFIDDDDIYLPEKIERCLRVLKSQNGSVGGVYGGYLGWNSKHSDPSRYVPGNLSKQLFSLNYQGHYIHTNTTLFTRESVFRIGGFDDSFRRHQDLEFMIRFFDNYQIDVVNQPVARLKPAPTSNNNQQYGKRLFDTKSKFLNKFKSNILSFSESEQREIYRAHWDEVRKYCESNEQFLSLCSADDDLGLLSYFMDFEVDPNKSEGYLALKSSNSSLQKEITHLKAKLKSHNSLRAQVASLEEQKIWYESTYESLPRFWKIVGSVIRKVKNWFD